VLEIYRPSSEFSSSLSSPRAANTGNGLKLPSLQPNHMHRPVTALAPANPCVNGPGTCQQCQSDPKSGLFCRSLAAIRATSGSATPDGCCSGNANGGGCCKSLPTAAPSQPPPSLTCVTLLDNGQCHPESHPRPSIVHGTTGTVK
jgi:hypothetical protein